LTTDAVTIEFMLSIPNATQIDKHRLIGGCVKLGVQFDSRRLDREIQQLPSNMWGKQGGRVGVHKRAEAIFLRGFAPAEGELPVDDRPILRDLPYTNSLIKSLIPAVPMRCLVARLPAGGTVAPHIDRADYFDKTIRLHMPIATSAQVLMYCGDRLYQMKVGEIWALNNSTVHAVWNGDPRLPRTHLICDFLYSEELERLIVDGDHDLGRRDEAIVQQLQNAIALNGRN